MLDVFLILFILLYRKLCFRLILRLLQLLLVHYCYCYVGLFRVLTVVVHLSVSCTGTSC